MNNKTTAKTPTEYIAKLEEPRKGEIKALHALIKKHAPTLKPFIGHGMLAYGLYHYVYASGREGDWAYIGLASQKNYISLYFSCVPDGKNYLAEGYEKQLPKANIGKSCVRFKRLSDLDENILIEMIEKTAEFAKKQK